MKKLIVPMLLAGLLFNLSVSAAETTTSESVPKMGSPAPELKLPDLEGKIVSLQSYQGKPVILVFFASWSKSCQAELKNLEKMYLENQGSVEVLAVSFDKKIKDLKSFLSKAEITFPILLDKKLSSLNKFQVLIIPTTFGINRDGIIEKIFVDYDENVKKAIAEWLTHS